MSLLAALAAACGQPVALDPTATIPDPDSTPYEMPTSAPWNAPTKIVGDLETHPMHPGAVDFGTPWNGHRFWMTYTPLSDNTTENPTIVVSADGYTWSEPVGISNPIDPNPGGQLNYNSDCDLQYDPDNDELVCMWREVDETGGGGPEILWASRSANGTTWGAPVVALSTPVTGDYVTLSPTMVRFGEDDWRLYAQNSDTNRIDRYTATSADGPYTNKAAGAWVGGSFPEVSIGHPYVLRRADGTLHGIIAAPMAEGGRGYLIASDDDGLSWAVGATPALTLTPGQWDSRQMYRATMQRFGPDHYRVWYSANGGDPFLWGIGYTVIPVAAWP